MKLLFIVFRYISQGPLVLCYLLLQDKQFLAILESELVSPNYKVELRTPNQKLKVVLLVYLDNFVKLEIIVILSDFFQLHRN